MKKLMKGLFALPFLVITIIFATVLTPAQVIDLPITVNVNYGEAAKFIDYMNQKRVEENKTPYIIDSALMDAARQRCADLAIVFSHASPLCDNSNQVCNYIRSAEGYEPSGVGENILVGVLNAEGVYKTWRNSEAYHAVPLLASAYKYCGCASVTYNHVVYWVLVTTSFPVGSPCKAGSGTSKWSTVVPTDSSYFHAYCYNNSIYYGENDNISEIRLVNRGDKTVSRGYSIPASLLKAVPRNKNIATIGQDGKIIPHNVGSTIVDVWISGVKTSEASPVIINVDPQASSIGRGNVTHSMSGSLENNYFEYTGKEIKPKVSMTDCFGKKMQEGTDFRVEYENNIEPSSNALACVYGLGNYSDGTSSYRLKTLKFTIESPEPIINTEGFSSTVSTNAENSESTTKTSSPASAKTDSTKPATQNSTSQVTPATKKEFKVVIADGKTSYKYNEKAFTPAVKVYENGDLMSPIAYKVSYSNNQKVGTAKITVTGIADYGWSGYKGSTTFKITEPDRGTFSVKLAKTNLAYNGKAQKPAVTVKVGSKTISNKYYTVSYSNNKNVGNATVNIKGKYEYVGFSGKANFSISGQFSKVQGLKGAYTYTGRNIKPKFKVFVGSRQVPAKNLKISFQNNKKVGIASIAIRGTGNYSLYSIKKSFYIVPKPTKKISYKKNGKKVVISCTNIKGVATYQFQISKNKKFTSAMKKNSRKNQATVKNLKKGTYYVRVRGALKIGKKTVYTNWKTKKIVIKK